MMPMVLQMEDEVKKGEWGEYQVYIRTGDRIGASSSAEVNITIYGEKGRTKPIKLATSKHNKVKFQRGKVSRLLDQVLSFGTCTRMYVCVCVYVVLKESNQLFLPYIATTKKSKSEINLMQKEVKDVEQNSNQGKICNGTNHQLFFVCTGTI